MDTKEMTREQISALADGELDIAHLDIALAALRQPAARSDWETYHQIGEVLRSDDMAMSLSPGFSARMAARLDAEPTVLAPAVATRMPMLAAGLARRWAVPGAVAAAVAAVVFVATPQLMVAFNGGAQSPAAGSPAMIASSAVQAVPVAATASAAAPGNIVATSAPDGVVLRDPRIDDYLLAHQGFSPSVFSSAQYARSAAFAADTSK